MRHSLLMQIIHSYSVTGQDRTINGNMARTQIYRLPLHA